MSASGRAYIEEQERLDRIRDAAEEMYEALLEARNALVLMNAPVGEFSWTHAIRASAKAEKSVVAAIFKAEGDR